MTLDDPIQLLEWKNVIILAAIALCCVYIARAITEPEQ